ncbi:hypothetical protein [Seonamhaeicola sp.]|uniref:hypothetical protein n=1 Tax=Seonamhaeicola sp. TaxID=1912245 RepID=UPI00261029BE|nr:hypothetical protein [Seonamhaeicola sp.]
MISTHFFCVRWLRSLCRFKLCTFITLFCIVTANSQQDSLEVEKLYKLGLDSLRIKPQASIRSFEDAMKIIDYSILTKEKHNKYFLLKKALILDKLSDYYRKDTEYVESLKAIQRSLKIKEDIGETYTLPITYRAFGRLYLHNRDSIKALQYYSDGLELSKQYNNAEEQVYALNSFSSFYRVYDDFEKSEQYAKKALNFADSIDFDMGKSRSLLQLVTCELRKKSYSSAVSYSEKNIELCEKNNDKIGLEMSFKDLGYIYRKMKLPKKAILYYKKSLDLVIELGLEGYIANRCLSLSNAYNDLGDYKLAFSYYRGYKRQQIKDMNVKSIKEFAQLEAKYNYQRQKAIDSVQLMEKQRVKESHLLQEASIKFWKIVSIITGVFGIMLALTIFLLRRRKEQIKISKLENEILQKEINYKQKDISDFALNLSRIHKWREELLLYIEKLKKSEIIKEDADFKALERVALEKELMDTNMVNLQDKADVINTTFYEKLHNRFPTLTKTEAKLCSLIRLNIDNNEIAMLQNVAIESVYKSRSRLRKKLNLSPKDDLNTFLIRL